MLIAATILLATMAYGASQLKVEDRSDEFIPSGSYMITNLRKETAYYCDQVTTS